MKFGGFYFMAKTSSFEVAAAILTQTFVDYKILSIARDQRQSGISYGKADQPTVDKIAAIYFDFLEKVSSRGED